MNPFNITNKPLSLLLAGGIATAIGSGSYSEYFGLYSALTEKVSDSKALPALMVRTYAAQAELLKIDWKATAPVVFCNQFAIGYDKATGTCHKTASKGPK